MGLFSFMHANTGNKENLRAGESTYALLPDKEPIFEASYDGYGHFGGVDVYEVTFDLNRGFITEEFFDNCSSSRKISSQDFVIRSEAT